MSDNSNGSDPKIKLVIWDLDETFWEGTLSEGPITPIQDNIGLIRKLTEHGIVNAICSKNDFENAKTKLIELEVWDYFVFPHISWGAKGPQVENIIKVMNLRDHNVLFVDDNALNINEVQHFCPNIKTLMPQGEDFYPFFNRQIERGKKDENLTRLKQYKVLEEKTHLAKDFTSNEEFLKQSEIQVTIIENPLNHIDRIEDLILRANQLNYTKVRDQSDMIRRIVESGQAYAVHVKDKYGDYGIVGFVAFQDARVRHFVFSCRTLNMGVELAVYHHFGAPDIEVMGEVAQKLNEEKPHWIRLKVVERMKEVVEDKSGIKALFLGGCDLESASVYLKNIIDVETYFNYPSKRYPQLQVHREGIEFLNLVISNNEAGIKNVQDSCFFVDEDSFRLPDLRQFNVIIYSPLIDFIQGRYQSKVTHDLRISFGDLRSPITSWEKLQDLSTRKGIPMDELERFSKNWQAIEFDYEDYKKKLTKLLHCIPSTTKIVLLTGARTAFGRFDKDLEFHHARMNKILTEVSLECPNVHLLDINKHIISENSFTNAIRHYSREVYYQMALEIIKMICPYPVFLKIVLKDKVRKIKGKLKSLAGI